jgi:F-type H+-transporting ATPase subunit b
VAAILEQLGLDQTYFYQLGVFLAAFILLSQIYFKPFLKIIEARNKAIHKNREDADAAIVQAKAMLESYQTQIRAERLAAKKQLEDALAEARKEEEKVLSAARTEAREIALSAAQELSKQEAQIRSNLAVDIESMALQLSKKLL